MPETAPLDVSEATVGYELDSITLRNIASVRYIRHHEWLDHLLGDPIPTSAIIPPKFTDNINSHDVDRRSAELEAEVAALEAERAAGWPFHLDQKKAHGLSAAIQQLRDNFGATSGESRAEQIRVGVEELLGVQVVEAGAMRPVEITYDRQALERAAEEEAKAAQAAADARKAVAKATAQATSGGADQRDTASSTGTLSTLSSDHAASVVNQVLNPAASHPAASHPSGTHPAGDVSSAPAGDVANASVANASVANASVAGNAPESAPMSVASGDVSMEDAPAPAAMGDAMRLGEPREAPNLPTHDGNAQGTVPVGDVEVPEVTEAGIVDGAPLQ